MQSHVDSVLYGVGNQQMQNRMQIRMAIQLGKMQDNMPQAIEGKTSHCALLIRRWKLKSPTSTQKMKFCTQLGEGES